MEEAFSLAKAGDMEAFARWMGKVELPLRRSLRRFARAVDVEVVVQEALVRMWLVALDPRRQLAGPGASLRFAFRVARNVALEEVRRNRQDRFVDLAALENLPEGSFRPELPDPAYGTKCHALSARIYLRGPVQHRQRLACCKDSDN